MTSDVKERRRILKDNPDCQAVFDLLYQVGGTACARCFDKFAEDRIGLRDTENVFKSLSSEDLVHSREPSSYSHSHTKVYFIPNDVLNRADRAPHDKRFRTRYVSDGLERGALRDEFLALQTKREHASYSNCIDHAPYRVFQPVFT